MLDDRTKAQLRALLYPVQFEQRPELGIERVLRMVVGRNTLQTTPSDYLRAIRLALESRDERLTEIIPQKHSEDTIRFYLQQLSNELTGMAEAHAVAGPLATS
jgi:hypothetical protein